MLTFDRDTLRECGLDMHETTNGFELHPNRPMPEEFSALLRQIADQADFSAGDREELFEFVDGKLIWSAVRRATAMPKRATEFDEFGNEYGKPAGSPRGKPARK